VTNSALQAYLGNNVVELKFVRRHQKTGWSDIRGLLGTTNPVLLNSNFGFQVLHFQPPKGVGMGYDYKSKNLCVVWDMFRQEYRVFGAEQVTVTKAHNVTTPEDIIKFEDYFYQNIINMSESAKLDFMGYTGQEQILQSPTAPDSAKSSIKDWMSNKYNAAISRFKNYFKR